MPSFEEAVQAMGRKVGVEEKIIVWLLKPDGGQVATMEDLAASFTTDADPNFGMVLNQAEASNKFAMASKPRQLWHAAQEVVENDKLVRKRGRDVIELDVSLSEAELKDIRDKFWARHKITFYPALDPCVALVSRLVREMVRRSLMVANVWKVKSREFMSKTIVKRTKVAGGLEHVHEEGQEERYCVDLVTYLRKLRMLLIAYAKAGIERRDGADPASPEPLGSKNDRIHSMPL